MDTTAQPAGSGYSRMIGPDWHFLTRAALLIALPISLWYAANSLALAVTAREPIPYFDQWVFIRFDYLRWIDGEYGWLDLFRRHGEHRILTTKLVLFADTAAFSMTGILPLAVSYVALAASAALSAFLCANEKRAAAGAFLGALGLAWATCQIFNFGMAFQVSYPLAHLFAFATLAALAVSLEKSSWWSLAAAAVADFLSVFSLGGSVFLIAPMALIAIWLRRADRFFWTLAGFHIALILAYFDMTMLSAAYGVSPRASLELLFNVIGLPVTTYPGAAGAIGALWFALVAGVLSYRAATGAHVDRSAAALAAVAAFAFVECAILAYTRTTYGVAPRYATVAIFLWGGTIAASWRLAGQQWRVPLIAAMMLLTVAANSPSNANNWRAWINPMEEAKRDIVRGDLSPGSLARIFPPPQTWLADAIRRTQALHLGPFARVNGPSDPLHWQRQ